MSLFGSKKVCNLTVLVHRWTSFPKANSFASAYFKRTIAHYHLSNQPIDPIKSPWVCYQLIALYHGIWFFEQTQNFIDFFSVKLIWKLCHQTCNKVVSTNLHVFNAIGAGLSLLLRVGFYFVIYLLEHVADSRHRYRWILFPTNVVLTQRVVQQGQGHIYQIFST